MDNLKRKWDNLLHHSAALAAVFVIAIAGIALIVTVGVAVVMAKIVAFVK